MWAIKKFRMDSNEEVEQRHNGLYELDEFRLKAYESSPIYKDMIKNYHDQKIENCEYVVGDLVLLFNIRCSCFRENSSPNELGHSSSLNCSQCSD